MYGAAIDNVVESGTVSRGMFGVGTLEVVLVSWSLCLARHV